MYMLHTATLWKRVCPGWAQVGDLKGGRKIQKLASHIQAVYVGVSTDGRDGPVNSHSKNYSRERQQRLTASSPS